MEDDQQQRLLFANSKQTSKVASSSDLRSTVLECHTKISKELVWGKKQSSEAIKYIDVSDAEAFALDSTIRAYWELRKSQNPSNNLFIDPALTKKLREISLSILTNFSDQFTREYSFVVPDPQIDKEKEDEKQKQRTEAIANRKLRLEKAKKEREERAQRMKERQQEENTTAEKAADKHDEATNNGLIQAPGENKSEAAKPVISENKAEPANPVANKAAAFNRFAMMKNSNAKKIEPIKKPEPKQQDSAASNSASPASNTVQKPADPAATNNTRKIQLPARFQRTTENKDVKKDEKKDEKVEKDEKDKKDEKDDKKDEKDEKDDKKDEKVEKNDEKVEKKDEKPAVTVRKPVNFSNFKIVPKIAPAAPKPKSDTEVKPPIPAGEENKKGAGALVKDKASGSHMAALQNFTNSTTKKTKAFTIPQSIKKRDTSSGSQVKEIQIIKPQE